MFFISICLVELGKLGFFIFVFWIEKEVVGWVIRFFLLVGFFYMGLLFVLERNLVFLVLNGSRDVVR